MSLWKRGNVYWSYVYVDGVRHARSTGTSNRRLAESVEVRFKEELTLRRNNLTLADPAMTFGELAARFLASGAAKPWVVERLTPLLPYFADTAVSNLRKPSVREYRVWRHAHKRVSETTVNRDLEALRHILYWAVDEGRILANPLARMPLVRERRKKRPVLSLDEEPKLLAECAPHLARIVTAALDTGMRRGELLHQRWEDVDFARELLFVTRSKTPEGEAREIPLTDRLFRLLWESRENEGPLFTFKGRSIQRIKTAWKAAVRRSGIRALRFHDLRHTFNTRLMEAGVMQEVRKALMGHSSGEDVHATYTHVELPIKREALHKLEAWVREHQAQAHAREEERKGDAEPATGGSATSGSTTNDRSNPRAPLSESPGAE